MNRPRSGPRTSRGATRQDGATKRCTTRLPFARCSISSTAGSMPPAYMPCPRKRTARAASARRNTDMCARNRKFRSRARSQRLFSRLGLLACEMHLVDERGEARARAQRLEILAHTDQTARSFPVGLFEQRKRAIRVAEPRLNTGPIKGGNVTPARQRIQFVQDAARRFPPPLKRVGVREQGQSVRVIAGKLAGALQRIGRLVKALQLPIGKSQFHVDAGLQ